MCIGIGIIVAVPDDGSPIQIFGKNGNSSHDTNLHGVDLIDALRGAKK